MRPGSLVPVPAKEVVALGAVGAVPPGGGVVDGFRAKDHTLLRVNGRDVTFSLGTTFFLGSSGTGAPDAAPDTHAAHHMPAHIFIQFDRWGDASRTGERAVALALEWVTRRGVALSEVGDHTYGHLMDYLQYALLQEGRFDDAKALVEQVRSDYDESGKAASLRVKLASTSARYLVETGQWDEAATLAETARSEELWETPAVLLAVGIGAARTGALGLAAEPAAGLAAAGPSAGLMAQEVSALIHLAQGDEETALQLLEETAQKNRAAPMPFGPANPLKPALELYGEVLLEIDRPGEAAEQFETVLARRPRRAASLLGVAQARAQLGDQAAAAG